MGPFEKYAKFRQQHGKRRSHTYRVYAVRNGEVTWVCFDCGHVTRKVVRVFGTLPVHQLTQWKGWL